VQAETWGLDHAMERRKELCAPELRERGAEPRDFAPIFPWFCGAKLIEAASVSGAAWRPGYRLGALQKGTFLTVVLNGSKAVPRH